MVRTIINTTRSSFYLFKIKVNCYAIWYASYYIEFITINCLYIYYKAQTLDETETRCIHLKGEKNLFSYYAIKEYVSLFDLNNLFH